MNKQQLKDLLYKKFIESFNRAANLNENLRANFIKGFEFLPDSLTIKDIKEIINK